MTLAAILAEHAAKSSTPVLVGVARCDAGTVAVQRVTPAIPVTPQKTTAELHAIRARLHTIALSLGIARVVIDELPVEELEATAEQAALCEGHTDGNGDPYAQSLLMFYLRGLADRVSTRA